MSKKWPFKKSPGDVVTALIEDVEDLTDRMALLEDRVARDAKFCATHHHTTYWPRPNEDDGLGDIGPVL